MNRPRLALAGVLSTALVLAPLVFLREAAAPRREVVAAAAASPARSFPARASRAAAADRVAAPVVVTTTVATTTAPPPPATAARTIAAVPTTTAAPRPQPPTPPPPGNTQTGEASWYAGPDGECAHNTAPIGATLRVTATATARSTTCRVTGRGPYNGRIVDLTRTTFARIADPGVGVVTVRVEW